MPREEVAKMMKTAPMRKVWDRAGSRQSPPWSARQEPLSGAGDAAASAGDGAKALMISAMLHTAQ